jgi:exonuclease III
MESNLSLLTFNVRGINDPKKREKVFNQITSQKCDFVFMQETKCGKVETGNQWVTEENIRNKNGNKKVEWSANHNTLRSNSCGVTTLVGHNSAKIIKQANYEKGRVIINLLELDNFDFEYLITVNVYAPNGYKERKTFFDNLWPIVKEFSVQNKCNEIIVAGDFNCVLDDKDRNTDQISSNKNDKSSEALQKGMDELNLIDCWNLLNPQKGSLLGGNSIPIPLSRKVAAHLEFSNL